VTPEQEYARHAAALTAYPDVQGEALWPGRLGGWHQRRPGVVPADRRWMVDGACVDEPVDLWFASQGHHVRDAQAICAGCGVRERCLEYAVGEMIVHGVWGGLTPRQRRPLQTAKNRKERS
jgi:WhiB family transcriptional regulator, redox-sensing transcriptional regulator